MKNVVVTLNSRRPNLITAVVASVLLTVFFAFFSATCGAIAFKEFGGEVSTVEGVVESVSIETDNARIVVGGRRFFLNVLSDYFAERDLNGRENFKRLYGGIEGMPVKITYAVNSLFGADKNAVAVSVDGAKEFYEYEEVVAYFSEENAKLFYVFTAICIIFVAITAVCVFFAINTPKYKASLLAEKFAEYVATLQPTAYKKKYKSIPRIVIAVAVLAAFVALIVADERGIFTTADITVLVIVGFAIILSSAMLVFNVKKSACDEIEFYSVNYPFDCDEFVGSYKGKLKVRLIENMKERRRNFPHFYEDAGSGNVVEFTDGGVRIYLATESDCSVFEEYSDESVFIRYDDLNFEAVEFLRKGKSPLTVIIKSRIAGDFDCYRGYNDLHFPLDVNLLSTIKKFGVKVERLDVILKTKKDLIERAEYGIRCRE